jgi:hypothetical protein
MKTPDRTVSIRRFFFSFERAYQDAGRPALLLEPERKVVAA